MRPQRKRPPNSRKMRVEDELTLPVVSISRLRMATDGAGVTTLVVSHGCPLRCKYCINPFTWRGRTRAKLHTPQSLADELKKDSLYFLATGGGVTFGGGEPLLHSRFIRRFKDIAPEGWRISIETSLNVPRENLFDAMSVCDELIVDVKDMNADIYLSYTGADNAAVKSNLAEAISVLGADNVRVRLPLIAGYNGEADRDKSAAELEGMGVKRIERFAYKTDIRK